MRSSQDRDAGTVACTMTHKGPRQHGPLKSREETEVTVGDEAGGCAMLVVLGFDRVLSFEKRRESWTLGGCKVELDEVPHLGTFVEVEGPKPETVMRVREQLGLADRPMSKASYIAMLMTHLQESGQPTRDVTFGTPPGPPAPADAGDGGLTTTATAAPTHDGRGEVLIE